MIEIGQVNIGESTVEYQNSAMKLKINNGEFQRGEVLITNNEIAWKNENSNDGFLLPWSKIVVTAIATEPTRCIYFMIDSKWTSSPAENSNGTEEANGDENEEGSEADSEEGMTEFWLVSENSDEDNIYFFMNKYPAANDSMESGDEDEEFLDGEDMEQMNINEDDPRFADP